ncbi:MAG: hypothetical protein P0Y59_24770 [Candidatus Sphingomonas phytovorans]|nr:hypothetical protein [Sphingomonas sp.]WEK00068.1 MAG: hypothetical protein P0Y59_24770 [Sphingomonas sp.]
MIRRSSLFRTLLRLVVPGALAVPLPAAAQSVQITHLSDLAFGTITNVGVDQLQSESVCAYSGILGGRYTVTASGSGASGAFTLANGSSLLPYEVQWSATSGQTSGTNLTSGAALAGQTTLLSCPILQTSNASLIVILRAASLSAATAGGYGGTLTIVLAPD